MIKGTSIMLLELTDGELTEEIVDDVLVGEHKSGYPNEQTDGRLLGYTLAIPKGDTHNWIDRLVSFWGHCYRTTGYPEQGIEENIPLRWHKKVKVELADISGICTVYDCKTYERYIYNYVCIKDTRGGIRIMQDGSKAAGRMQVQIYAPVFTAGDYIPKTGDMIIPCECPLEVDTTSEQTVSHSLKAIKAAYPQYAAVAEVSFPYYGSKPDIVIQAR